MPKLKAKVQVRRQWTFDSLTEPNSDYYTCFCNVHCHKYMYALTAATINFSSITCYRAGASVAAKTAFANLLSIFVGIILSALTLICALCAAQFKLTTPPLISLFIFSLAYIGNQKALPIFYIPLMVIQIIFVVSLIVSGIFVIGYGSAVIFNSVVAGEKNPRKRAEIWLGIICMCLGTLMLIVSMILTYLTQVVYHAFRYLKDIVIGYKGPPECTPDYAHVY